MCCLLLYRQMTSHRSPISDQFFWKQILIYLPAFLQNRRLWGRPPFFKPVKLSIVGSGIFRTKMKSAWNTAFSPIACTRALSTGNRYYYIRLHSVKILTEWSHELHWAAPGAGLFLGAWGHPLRGAPRLPPLHPSGSEREFRWKDDVETCCWDCFFDSRRRNRTLNIHCVIAPMFLCRPYNWFILRKLQTNILAHDNKY